MWSNRAVTFIRCPIRVTFGISESDVEKFFRTKKIFSQPFNSFFRQFFIHDRTRFTDVLSDIVDLFSGHVGSKYRLRERTTAERSI